MKNVLFIMCDQLGWDRLGCCGHPYLRTPSLDALAARGVRCDRAFVDGGVCGPLRTSDYTGRGPGSRDTTWSACRSRATAAARGRCAGRAGAACAGSTLRKRRTAVSQAFVEAGTDRHEQAGVFFGQW